MSIFDLITFSSVESFHTDFQCSIVPVKVLFSQKKADIFSFSKKCCGYSIGASQRGSSNEYHNTFLYRNKEENQHFLVKKTPPYLELVSKFFLFFVFLENKAHRCIKCHM